MIKIIVIIADNIPKILLESSQEGEQIGTLI
jgi:hypothetical protein